MKRTFALVAVASGDHAGASNFARAGIATAAWLPVRAGALAVAALVSLAAGDPEGARSSPAGPSRAHPACRSRPSGRARPGGPSFRCADASVGAGPASGRNHAATSDGAASRASARDNAPANHPRKRVAEPWSARSRDGTGVREEPNHSSEQFPGAILSGRARAHAPPGESGAGSRQCESGGSRNNRENRAARRVGGDRRASGQRCLGSGTAFAKDARVRSGVRLGAKSSRRAPDSRQNERCAGRQAAESR